jgi:anaerobic ribonucleoside-triphosphate reductase activating protein
MRYAGIDSCDLCNGNNIGMSLYVQGCNAHCKNCFNPETWDFNGGKEWTRETESDFLSSVERPYIKRVSFLGGEPLADENIQNVLYLICLIKKMYPDKQIWVYTGFEYEYILNRLKVDETSLQLFSNIDYLVDGRYIDRLHSSTIPFRGSKNQRIINVQESLKQNKIVLYKED